MTKYKYTRKEWIKDFTKWLGLEEDRKMFPKEVDEEFFWLKKLLAKEDKPEEDGWTEDTTGEYPKKCKSYWEVGCPFCGAKRGEYHNSNCPPKSTPIKDSKPIMNKGGSEIEKSCSSTTANVHLKDSKPIKDCENCIHFEKLDCNYVKCVGKNRNKFKSNPSPIEFEEIGEMFEILQGTQTTLDIINKINSLIRNQKKIIKFIKERL